MVVCGRSSSSTVSRLRIALYLLYTHTDGYCSPRANATTDCQDSRWRHVVVGRQALKVAMRHVRGHAYPVTRPQRPQPAARRALQAVRPRNRPVTIPSKVKFPRTMTSKGVKVQSKVTFDKPVTGFFALLQGGTSCFARRV